MSNITIDQDFKTNKKSVQFFNESDNVKEDTPKF